jgi:phage FluMu gp28-like protein
MDAEEIEKMRSEVTRGWARRVIDNEWVPATEEPLLPFDLLKTCFDADCLWPNGEVPRGQRPILYIGADIGFTHDPTVIWTWEMIGDVLWCREVFVMMPHGKPLEPAAIKHEIVKRINTPFCHQFRLDEGAVGYGFGVELELEYRYKAEGVTLGSAVQGQLALGLKVAFENKRVRIPDNVTRPDITNDLMLIDQVETANGKPRLKTNRDESGHGDRFWAAALALYGVPIEQKRTFAPRPRVIRG